MSGVRPSVAGLPGGGLDHDRDGDVGADEDRFALFQGGEVAEEVLAEGLS